MITIKEMNLLNRMRKSISFDDLSNLEYCLVGNGAYAYQVLQRLNSGGITLPTYWLVSELQPTQPYPEYKHIIQIIDDKKAQLPTNILLLGTGHFQLEMMARLSSRCSTDTHFLDLMLTSPKINSWRGALDLELTNKPYVIYFDVYADINTKAYLNHFFDAINRHGLLISIHHPLEILSNDFLQKAQSILVWNGSTTSFQPILDRCQKLGSKVTFMECGFFPQHQFFYLDKCGVNAQSQLKDDDLDWVGATELHQLKKFRLANQNKCRSGLNNPQGDYIFVPLQVPTDSNVINHSRFNNGMQEFIDYIEQTYPNETLLFKAHPKDLLAKHYLFKHGKLVSEDVFNLIVNAKIIHGINSSVLYEAALLGRPVIAEGDCLLKHHEDKVDKLLAGVIARQLDVSSNELHWNKLQQFSHLKLPLVNTEQTNWQQTNNDLVTAETSNP